MSAPKALTILQRRKYLSSHSHFSSSCAKKTQTQACALMHTKRSAESTTGKARELRKLAITSNNICGYSTSKTRSPNCWVMALHSSGLSALKLKIWVETCYHLVGRVVFQRYTWEEHRQPVLLHTNLWCLPLRTWEVRIRGNLSQTWEKFEACNNNTEQSYSQSLWVSKQMLQTLHSTWLFNGSTTII